MRVIFGFFFLAATLAGNASAPGETAPRELRALTSSDRVLVLSPHPDDESLGAGGLIQKAVAAHAKVRVVFATDGEANPWAQRFVEHRIGISARDRARWGDRRKHEALRALATLGVSKSDVIFLDLPDQGLTRLLMANDKAALAKFRAALGDWQPTVAAFTSRYDVHADHNACFVFARLALGPPNSRLTELEFIVHKKPLADSRGQVVLNLSAGEVAKKRDAILCHASQTALSKKSLAAFAKPAELFYEFNAPREFDANNPMREATARRGVLTLKLSDEKSPREFRKSSLLVVAGNALWTFSAPFSAGAHVSGRAVENYSGARSEIDVTLPQIARPVFVKLNQRGLFLDKSGWREVPLR